MGWHFYTPDVDPGIGTSLPSNPVDGQEFVLTDSLSAPTYAWHLRYIAAKSSNKWQFIGGSPLYAEVTTSEGTTSGTYAALATAGPSVTLPIAGDYLVTNGALVDSSGTVTARMSYDIGGTGAVDADSMEQQIPGTGQFAGSRERKKAGLTAVTLTSKYKSDGSATATFSNRWLRVIPIAVGG